MFRRIYLVLSLLFLILPIDVMAAADMHADRQTPVQPRFSSLEIGLWPEYDQPSVLVIYTMLLAADTVFPAEIEVRIPTAAGLPTAVATGPAVDNLFDVEPTRRVEGQWSTISIKTYVPVVRLEYYDPALIQEGNLRKFIFSWLSPYEAEHVYLQVQQPYGGGNLLVNPQPQKGTWISDGVLSYYNADFGALKASQPLSLSIQYQKDTSELSVTGLQVKPTMPIDSQTSGRATIWSTIPWILFIPLLIITLLVGATWYWRLDLSAAVPSPFWKRKDIKTDNRSEKKSAEDENDSLSVNGGVHCHQCGRRSNPGDRFCRSCGTLLRTE